VRNDFNRRCYAAYNTLLLPLSPAAILYTLYRRHIQGRSAASLRGQQGYVPASVVHALHPAPGRQSGPCIWIHAVSVGETMAARPVARALREALPHCRIGFSVTTDTGYETAQGAVRAGDVDAVFYFPLDLPVRVRRALRAVKPDVFITMETELWPNFLSLARQRGVHTFLVNGRVSDNLLKTAPRLGWVWRWMMGNLDAALMRSDFDAERLQTLPGAPARIEVTGDVKLDSVPTGAASQAARETWREKLGIVANAPLWVAGSTHSGEEELILRGYTKLRQEMPQLRLILAPRHIERVDEVMQVIHSCQLPAVRRTQVETVTPSLADAVIVLDTVGELAQIYAAADVAFVGGSLIERGGHNLLEPVLCGVPVAFGPYVMNFREASKLAESANVGRMVHNEQELYTITKQWLRDDAARRDVAERARTALIPHHGAAARVARIVAETVTAKQNP